MRCLVTGNHGYIGHILVHELLKKGHEVVGYDWDYFPRDCFGRRDAFESSKQIKQIIKDLRDIKSEDLKGFDTIIHLAALPNDPACDLNAALTTEINHLTTLKLALAAKRAGVKRFVFASSCAVYGIKGDNTSDETNIPNPITIYGKSKVNSEIALKKLNSRKFTVVSLRNATCYGVSPRMRFDMILHGLLGLAFTEGRINMHLSDGTAWRPMIHLEDLAQAYISVIEAPHDLVAGQIFNVGSENYRVIDIAEIAKKAVPNSTIAKFSEAPKDLRSYKCSFNKIKNVLNFKPKWTTEKGAQEIYRAFKEFGLTKELYLDKIFWAGKYYKYLIDKRLVDSNLRAIA